MNPTPVALWPRKRPHATPHWHFALQSIHYVPVGNGGVPGLYGPKGLAERADGGGGVEDDLGAVEAVHHPVLRVVPPVADVHGDAPELREKRMIQIESLFIALNTSTSKKPLKILDSRQLMNNDMKEMTTRIFAIAIKVHCSFAHLFNCLLFSVLITK